MYDTCFKNSRCLFAREGSGLAGSLTDLTDLLKGPDVDPHADELTHMENIEELTHMEDIEELPHMEDIEELTHMEELPHMYVTWSDDCRIKDPWSVISGVDVKDEYAEHAHAADTTDKTPTIPTTSTDTLSAIPTTSTDTPSLDTETRESDESRIVTFTTLATLTTGSPIGKRRRPRSEHQRQLNRMAQQRYRQKTKEGTAMRIAELERQVVALTQQCSILQAELAAKQ